MVNTDANTATPREGGRLSCGELEELVAAGFNRGYETEGKGLGYQEKMANRVKSWRKRADPGQASQYAGSETRWLNSLWFEKTERFPELCT